MFGETYICLWYPNVLGTDPFGPVSFFVHTGGVVVVLEFQAFCWQSGNPSYIYTLSVSVSLKIVIIYFGRIREAVVSVIGQGFWEEGHVSEHVYCPVRHPSMLSVSIFGKYNRVF